MSTGNEPLYDRLQRFVTESSTLDAIAAERRLLPILQDLMYAQGFEVGPVAGSDTGIDFIGQARPDGPQQGRIGIEFKHRSTNRPITEADFEQALTYAHRAEVQRLVVISQSGFSRRALDLARQDFPFAVQLLTYDDLSNLARSVDAPSAGPSPQIATLIRRFSEEAARLVAQNPAALDDLEWRDIERMMAVVLDSLGFQAELTPGSKDGGKDIILTLQTASGSKTYIVELKHWRSGKRVGENAVRDFVNVVAREQREAGLFLSTYGFTNDAFETLTEIERSAVRFGGKQKVVSLCRSFVRVGANLLAPDNAGLADALFSDTA